MTHRILITGINGFVGKYITKELLMHEDIQIMGFDRAYTNNHFGKNVLLNRVNLLDKDVLKNVISEFNPTSVLHLAAIASPIYGNVGELYDINVHGSENLLDVLYDVCDKSTRVILTSTAGVYGNSNVDFDKEDETPYNPANHYSFSKMIMEYISKNYMDKLDIKIIRPFNMIGVGQKEIFLVPKLVKAFATRQQELEIGNMNTQRDFIDIDFAAKFFCKLVLSKEIEYNIMNLCSGNATTGNEILDILKEITQYSPKIIVNPRFIRKNEIMRMVGDPTRCNKFVNGEFNTKSVQTILEEMVKECL